MKKRIKNGILGVLILVVSACTSQQGRKINAESAMLKQFTSCAAIDKARTLRKELIEVRGFTDSAPPGAPVAANESGDAVNGETNLQVDGVDEMDTTKADDDFIYRLQKNWTTDQTKLLVVRRAPVNQAGVVQIVNLGSSYPAGMFLTEGKAIVLLNAWSNYTEQTKIVSYDRNLDGSLTQTSTRSVDGYLASARMTGTKIHLVVNQYVGAIYENDENAAEPIGGMLPHVYRDGAKVKTPKCTDIWHEVALEEPSNYGYGILDNLTGVLSFDIGQDNEVPQGVWIAGNYASIVFASQSNLFLASYGWDASTPIHQIRLATNDFVSTYIGTALVNGYPLNQFSMDEYDGYFRIAITDQADIGFGCNGDVCTAAAESVDAQANSLLTFKLGEGNPILKGELRGLAKGESIFAVRFMKDRAFIVTFLQRDPLFAIDLSDQENPILKGELKIPGFSNHLHPISERYLLGIGQSADNDGTVNGLALSIFDVANLSDPKQVQKIKIGSAWSSSEAQYDHHAFRYIEETHQLVIPVELMNQNYQSTFSGFQIYDVSVANGFNLLGQSPFADANEGYGSRAFYKDGIISMVGGGSMTLRDALVPNADLTQIVF